MAKYWKWECLGCQRTFVRETAEVIKLQCKWCKQEDKGFQKVKEQETKYE